MKAKLTVFEKVQRFIDLGKIQDARREMNRIIIDEKDTIDYIITTLLVGGHSIIDGDPGTAKTALIYVLGDVMGLPSTKVQFSGDMTPDQLKGFEIPVPIFTDAESIDRIHDDLLKTIVRPGEVARAILLIADEINRASAEMHNSMLSLLNEGDFRIGNRVFKVHEAFTCIMTRNFIEIEGVRNISYAFLDRIFFSNITTYPATLEAECKITSQPIEMAAMRPKKIMSVEDFLKIRKFFRYNPDLIIEDSWNNRYANRLARATRADCRDKFKLDFEKEHDKKIQFGASPRTAKWFNIVAQVYAHCILQEKRVTPDHIQHLAKPFFRHRMLFQGVTAQESMQLAEEYIDYLVKHVPILD